MSETKTGFIGQVTGLLYKPRMIFSEMKEEDLTKGLIVMLVMVILSAYSRMLYMDKIPLSVLSPQLEGIDTSQFEGTLSIFAGIGSGLTIITGWIASTILMHGVGRLSGGNGSIKRFFAMHGFASILGLINQIIRIIDASIIDPASLASYYVTYGNINNKIIKAILSINLVNIWGLATIALMVIAVEENYNTSNSRSILIVLLPSLFNFLIIYFLS